MTGSLRSVFVALARFVVFRSSACDVSPVPFSFEGEGESLATLCCGGVGFRLFVSGTGRLTYGYSKRIVCSYTATTPWTMMA